MGMLDGIRVIDMTMNAAGPGAASMFADHGAEVIKVERPITGDDCRSFGPFLDGVSLSDAWTNRGKKSVTVNLQDSEGVEFVKKLAADADIFLESFRPGVMARLGLGYEVIREINPKIIYGSLTAFGQNGPYAKRPGYDIIAQAMSGLMAATGEPEGDPMPVGVALGDFVGAQNLYAGVMTALYHRAMTGHGQWVDISLVQGLIFMNGNLHQYAVGRKNAPRAGAHNSLLSPYGLHHGKDGQCAIVAAVGKKIWESLCDVIGHPELKEDPKFNNVAPRVANRKELTAYIEDWLKQFDNINDAVDILQAHGVPSCKVYGLEDVILDKHFREQGWIVEQSMPDNCGSDKTFFTRAPVGKYSECQPQLHKGCVLGAYNHEVMAEYGYSEEDIDRLQKKWAEKK